jgi:hypothetical protein
MVAVWGIMWPASATSPGPMTESGGIRRDSGAGGHKGPHSAPHHSRPYRNEFPLEGWRGDFCVDTGC